MFFTAKIVEAHTHEIHVYSVGCISKQCCSTYCFLLITFKPLDSDLGDFLTLCHIPNFLRSDKV